MQTQTRFEFGENWKRFLALVNDQRIVEAEKSLHHLLGRASLSGQSFLDIGCGSGLFSLAAARLGASVRSFDFDLQSVACTQEMKRRFGPPNAVWNVEQGSVLDTAYLDALGTYDVVYSWGVLHHTGAMWQAITNAGERVKPQGFLAIALYNDQGLRSRGWLKAKRGYNRLPSGLRPLFAGLFLPLLWGPTVLKDFFRGNPLRSWTTYASRRGMSPWRDLVDWVGGLPFEVATPERVVEFGRARGFELVRSTRVSGYGCNEFVFRRIKT
jgi:2-polyprenyl-3-methyl-5-hydroxy-6-metoxy-1,4-benzoquinol methylase